MGSGSACGLGARNDWKVGVRVGKLACSAGSVNVSKDGVTGVPDDGGDAQEKRLGGWTTRGLGAGGLLHLLVASSTNGSVCLREWPNPWFIGKNGLSTPAVGGSLGCRPDTIGLLNITPSLILPCRFGEAGNGETKPDTSLPK